MLAYFFTSTDGVGASRSRSLYEFLQKNGFLVHCICRNTWHIEKAENALMWGLRCAYYIFKQKDTYKKIYISCGPFLPIIPVSLAARLVKKPLIIDFRDPWSLNIATNYGSTNEELTLKQRIRLRISRAIEQFVYKTCQHFIVCTEGMKADYAKLFQDNKKLRLITNGYDFDPEVYDDISGQSGEVKFVCMGKFAEYCNEKASYILTKIKQYGEAKKRTIKLVFIGSDRDQNEPLVNELDLLAEWYPRLPYQEAVAIAAKADFGLCLIRNESYEYGTKIFDYIGLGLPIFDYFQEDNNFRSYFRAYLSTEIKRIPLEDRLNLSREQVFRRNMDVFE